MKSKNVIALIAIVGFVSALPAQAAEKPNIVFIMGDDIGMWNIGAYRRGMDENPILTARPCRC